MTIETTTLLQTAYRYHQAGANVLTTGPDKRPIIGAWQKWTTNRQSIDDVDQMPWSRAHGIAIIGGRVSGGVVCIDVDLKYDVSGTLEREFISTFNAEFPAEFQSMPAERTPSGGMHVLFRTSSVIACQKLARRPATAEELAENPKRPSRDLIEIKSHGGYFVCDPTPGYRLSGKRPGLDAIPEIPVQTALSILDMCKGFNSFGDRQAPGASKPSKEFTGWEISPLDDYNARTSDSETLALLESHGWRVLRSIGQSVELQRPNADRPGKSATFGKIPECLYVFTSSAAPFETEHTYSKAAVYATLEHGGDFSKAARKLLERGYGKRAAVEVKTESGVNLQLLNDCGDPCITDETISQQMLAMYGDRIRYNHTRDRFHTYTGKIWTEDHDDESYRMTHRAVGELIATINTIDNPKIKGPLLKSAQKYLNSKILKSAREFFASQKQIAVAEHHLDRDLHLFNCQNGTLNLETGELLQHDPRHMITRIGGAAYRPGAGCERWLSFLDRIFAGDTETIDFMRRWFGYSLSGELFEEAYVLALGGGKNGKSVLYDVIARLYGTYFHVAPVDIVLMKDHTVIPVDIARLKGARSVLISEIPEGKRFDEKRLKDLSSSEKLTGRYLYGNPFDFVPSHKLNLHGNHRPNIRSTDSGTWRRIHHVPFNVTIPDHERIERPVLVAQLCEELDGIMSWAYSGYQDFRRGGLRPSQAVQDATGLFRGDCDTIGQFIEECCDLFPSQSTSGTKLYEEYERWAKASGEYIRTKKAFSTSLVERGFKVHVGHQSRKSFIGLTLKAPEAGF